MKTTVAFEYKSNKDSSQNFVVFPECQGCNTCFDAKDLNNEKQDLIQEAFEGWISTMVEVNGEASVSRFNNNEGRFEVPVEPNGVLVAVWVVRC